MVWNALLDRQQAPRSTNHGQLSPCDGTPTELQSRRGLASDQPEPDSQGILLLLESTRLWRCRLRDHESQGLAHRHRHLLWRGVQEGPRRQPQDNRRGDAEDRGLGASGLLP